MVILEHNLTDDDFELMYQSLTEENGSSSTHLLNVSENDLAKTFRPGETEIWKMENGKY